MKPFKIFTTLLAIMLIASACRAEPVPTAAPVDLQGTIAAAAFTVIAETQAAIPTATPPPPTATFTDTPLPTNTLPPLPPPGVTLTLTPAPNGNSGSGDPCINQVMPEPLKGEPIQVRISNSTKVKLSVSINLNQTVPNGQCGYRSYTLDPGQKLVLNNLVAGCYTLWAWNPDPENYFIVTNGTNCLDTSNSWVFDISTNSLKLEP